jgi:hypothetical protein
MSKARQIADYAGTGAATDLATQAELDAVSTVANAAAPKASPTFTGTVSGVTATHVGLGNVTNESKTTMFSSPSLTGASIFTGGIVEKVGTASNSGTTVTVDLATGNFFQVDMASNSGNITTFTINNTNGTSNQISSFILKVENSASNRNFTWSSLTNIDWAGGTGPDLTAGDGKIDILSFTTYNNGTTWYGAIVGQDFT